MPDLSFVPPVATCEPTECLTELANHLRDQGYDARVVLPTGDATYMHVCNPRVAAMSEDVFCDAGWFCYSWGQRIGRTDAVAASAAQIARVLRGLDCD